jgi:hypothetical protein
MVDNNEKLVTALLKHQSEFNTGEQRENEDGWEEGRDDGCLDGCLVGEEDG